MNDKRVICVLGPTAVGKSDVAVDICLRYGGQVISADSMQIYRGMDVGTAKLNAQEQRGIQHHLLDMVDPATKFTVAQWQKAADEVIERLHSQHVLPVVCGGTGLYIRSITDDLDFSTQPDTAAVREKWLDFAEKHGREALHRALELRDVDSANRLHPNDVKRVVRALEIAETSGKMMSTNYDWTPKSGRYQVLLIGLWMEREALYKRVDKRVDMMVEAGLFDEVRALRDQGITSAHTALQAIGYKEIDAYFDGACTAQAAIEAIKRNTRRFVKRQLSWFRRDPRVQWFERTDDGDFAAGENTRLWRIIEEFLEGKCEGTRE